jgi:tetratricopeptide (TPR) repeat protein
VTVLVSLLVVALATIAVGSTIVAKRASEARDRAKRDFAAASAGYDALVVAVATNVKPARKELLQPALDYYQKFTQSHAGDKDMLCELATAKFHMAALHAKLGSKEGVTAMTQGLGDLYEMTKVENADPASFPSLQDSALKVTTPFEWFRVKEIDQKYALQMTVAINRATDLYTSLAKKYPQHVPFRDNQSALLKSAALLQSQLPGASGRSLESWLRARDILETLVRDQPTNKDYQVRLAESLVNAARMQRTAKENEKATANLNRAIEVREQLAAANPDDKAIKQDLTVAKRDLERLLATTSQPAPAAKEKPEADEEAAVGEKKDAPAPDKEPPVAEKKEPPATATEAPTAEKDAPPADAPAADAPVADKNPPQTAP